MQETDANEKPRELTSKLAYLAMLIALPIFILFCILGKWETGIGAWICEGIVVLILIQRWDLRRHFWFWLIVALGALLQVPVVRLIPWNDRNLTGISLLPVGLLDYGLVYGRTRLVERTIGSKCESPNDR